jgi:hypothetical protein
MSTRFPRSPTRQVFPLDSEKKAEAHAEAARQFIMAELVTKQDLTLALETQTLRLTVRLGAMSSLQSAHSPRS